MKISINESEGKSFQIRIPTALLTSRIGMGLFKLFTRINRANEYKDEFPFNLPPEQLDRLRIALKEVRKKHGRMTLVEVESDDGTNVEITL